jgi:hypothetical protein
MYNFENVDKSCMYNVWPIRPYRKALMINSKVKCLPDHRRREMGIGIRIEGSKTYAEWGEC